MSAEAAPLETATAPTSTDTSGGAESHGNPRKTGWLPWLALG
jgi:hypothetical protein